MSHNHNDDQQEFSKDKKKDDDDADRSSNVRNDDDENEDGVGHQEEADLPTRGIGNVLPNGSTIVANEEDIVQAKNLAKRYQSILPPDIHNDDKDNHHYHHNTDPDNHDEDLRESVETTVTPTTNGSTTTTFKTQSLPEKKDLSEYVPETSTTTRRTTTMKTILPPPFTTQSLLTKAASSNNVSTATCIATASSTMRARHELENEKCLAIAYQSILPQDGEGSSRRMDHFQNSTHSDDTLRPNGVVSSHRHEEEYPQAEDEHHHRPQQPQQQQRLNRQQRYQPTTYPGALAVDGGSGEWNDVSLLYDTTMTQEEQTTTIDGTIVSSISVNHHQEQQPDPFEYNTIQAYVDEILPAENVKPITPLPGPTITNLRTNPQQRGRRCYMILLIVVFVLSFVGMAGIIYWILSSRDNDNHSGGSSSRQPSQQEWDIPGRSPVPTPSYSQFQSHVPTTTEFPSQSVAPTSLEWTKLLDLLQDRINLEVRSFLDDRSSYQYQAFNWLASQEIMINLFQEEIGNEDDHVDRLVTYYALAALYYAGNANIGGTTWLSTTTSSSSSSTSYCSWRGIHCNDNNTIIYLISRYFTGSLPPEIGLLTTLQRVDLSGSALRGALPTEIGQLTSLRRLLLKEGNTLTGCLPTEIGQLTLLEHLNLRGHNFTSILPTEIGQLTALSELRLMENAFTGTLPSEIGQLTSLSEIRLADNYLIGMLPTEIGYLTDLTLLNPQRNDFTGTFPSNLYNLSSLLNLRLDGNRFRGTLPTEIGQMSALTRLSLNNNNFVGDVPSEIGRLLHVKEMHLAGNYFTGVLPTEIGELTSITDLDLGSNNFTGMIPREIAKLTNLQELDLQLNNFMGNVTSLFCMQVMNNQGFNHSRFPNLRLATITSPLRCDCCSLAEVPDRKS